MENLESVSIFLDGPWQEVGKYISENYNEHCIESSEKDTLDLIPVKIFYPLSALIFLDGKKYTPHLEYIGDFSFHQHDPMANGWDRYREIFDQCVNLKAMEFGPSNLKTEVLPTLSKTDQDIWKERFCYFQKRGIRIAENNEICVNQNLRQRLAKEAGITWIFQFN
jgi:hypothetical protein